MTNKTLVIAEHDHTSLKAATLNTVTAAKKLGGEIHVLIAGQNCGAVAEAAAKIDGVAKVRVVDAGHYASQGVENVAALIVASAAGYSHILASATVRATVFEAAGTGGAAAVEQVAPAADLGLSAMIGCELTKSARPELATARTIVAGGRGLGSGEKFHELLEPLADKLGAALGASRAAVDGGYVPNDYQVGQTGHIVAINKDPDAPIFQVADYGLVGDLFQLIPELTAEPG